MSEFKTDKAKAMYIIKTIIDKMERGDRKDGKAMLGCDYENPESLKRLINFLKELERNPKNGVTGFTILQTSLEAGQISLCAMITIYQLLYDKDCADTTVHFM